MFVTAQTRTDTVWEFAGVRTFKPGGMCKWHCGTRKQFVYCISPSVLNCARAGCGNPWSYTTDCYITECIILCKYGRKKFADIRLRVLVMNMETANTKPEPLLERTVPHFGLYKAAPPVCLWLTDGSERIEVQHCSSWAGVGEGAVRNMIMRRSKSW